MHSSDTVDHVERVRYADAFWEQFNGRSQGDPRSQSVQGVSGATLTSLAIAEAIELRMAGRRSSLRFPEELTLEDVQPLVPEAASVTVDPKRTGFYEAKNESGQAIGWLLRTGPLDSNTVGYQGPTN